MPKLWLKLVHQPQRYEADCLAACAAMVLEYLGQSVEYAQLLHILNITPNLGAPASHIKRLSTLGLGIVYRAGTISDLMKYLAQNIPCIVFVNTIELDYWTEATRHAVVVVGIDERQVYLNDPFFEVAPQIVSRLEFELAWDEMDNSYAVITR